MNNSEADCQFANGSQVYLVALCGVWDLLLNSSINQIYLN